MNGRPPRYILWGRDLALANDLDSYVRAILQRTKDTFGNEVIIFLSDPLNKEKLKSHTLDPDINIDENDYAGPLFGLFNTSRLSVTAQIPCPTPLRVIFPWSPARGIVGVLALREPEEAPELTLAQERLMEAYADLSAVAIEGILLTQESRNNEILKASERLQTALLNSHLA